MVRVAVLTYDLVICKDSNDCLGGGGYANKFMDLKNVGEVMPKYFRDLKKNVGGGGGS